MILVQPDLEQYFGVKMPETSKVVSFSFTVI